MIQTPAPGRVDMQLESTKTFQDTLRRNKYLGNQRPEKVIDAAIDSLLPNEMKVRMDFAEQDQNYPHIPSGHDRW